MFIFNLQILCENDNTVLVTLKEEKLFGEVSAHYKTRVHEVITKHLQPTSNVKILQICFERATVLEKGNRSLPRFIVRLERGELVAMYFVEISRVRKAAIFVLFACSTANNNKHQAIIEFIIS